MRIEADVKLGFRDVMIRPKRSVLSSRSEVNLEREFSFVNSRQTWKGIPLIAANMDTVATFSMAKALARHHLLTAIHKHYSLDQWRLFLQQSPPEIYDYIMYSCGSLEKEFTLLKKVLAEFPDIRFLCLDVANGYTEHFIRFVQSVREHYPDKTIIAGNVATGEIVEELILSGADIVKVGIGPGSVCTTRVKTGVGYPQLSAIIECADAAHGLKGQIIGDGGCVQPGDVAKAFGGGADFVMLGGMLAGHEECEGSIVELEGQKFIEFYGMSSAESMQKYHGEIAEYRATEGKRALVPFKGAVEKSVRDILGGIRSTCTYVGARQLKELTKRTTFLRVREQDNTIYS